MKYKSIVLIVILLCLTIPLQARGDFKVEFEDTDLEKVIRTAINKPSGDIYASELMELKKLDAGSDGIISINGIEYCSSLEKLYLDDNQISDLSPLAGLTSLEALILIGNPLNDEAINDIIPLLREHGAVVYY